MHDRQYRITNYWTVKKGNTAVQEIPVYDENGNLVQDLDQAQEITFKVKENPTDTTAKITKTKADGIEINQPSTGYLRITLKPSDTNIPAGDYYMGLEIEWDADKIYEINLSIDGQITNLLVIEQDVVS